MVASASRDVACRVPRENSPSNDEETYPLRERQSGEEARAKVHRPVGKKYDASTKRATDHPIARRPPGKAPQHGGIVTPDRRARDVQRATANGTKRPRPRKRARNGARSRTTCLAIQIAQTDGRIHERCRLRDTPKNVVDVTVVAVGPHQEIDGQHAAGAPDASSGYAMHVAST